MEDLSAEKLTNQMMVYHTMSQTNHNTKIVTCLANITKSGA